MESNRHMNCILRVDTQSSGWEKCLTKLIKRVKGVSYSIHAASGVVRISGETIDPNKLLTDIAKAGKHAELIHADCGNGNTHGYGYDYDAGYGRVEAHPYPSYGEAQTQRGLTYTQSDPYGFHSLAAPDAERVHAPILALPSAPPLKFHPPSNNDPNDPSCNIM